MPKTSNERHRGIRRALLLTAVLCAGPQTSRSAPVSTLIAIDTIGSDSSDFSLPTHALLPPVTALRLRFDLPVLAAVADFRVIADGTDGIITTTCQSPVAGDDSEIAVAMAISGADGHEVVLRLDSRTGLTVGRYRLLVCGALEHWIGVTPKRKRVDLPDATTIRDFTIAESPQLENPNFSTDLALWSFPALSPSTSDAAWHPVDADGVDASGSLRITGTPGTSVLARSDTCVRVRLSWMSTQLAARIRYRYRVLSGNVRIVATATTGFSGDMGEPECIGPHVSYVERIHIAAAAGKFATFDSGRIVMRSGPLATFSLRVIGTGDAPFEILLDDIGFSLDPNLIFSARFERDDF